MGVVYQVSQIYDAAINQITTSEEEWKSVCRMIGQLYRYEFDNILMVYMQRPRASLVADFDTWKRVGRYVFCLSNYVFIYSLSILWITIHGLLFSGTENKRGRCPHPASGINMELLAIIIMPME